MMEIPIRLNVTGQWIKTGGIVLVSSSVNIYSCSFVFSDDWNGYTKTAVFCLNDGTNFEVPILQDTCNIPWEALQEPGNLRIGVYGIMGSGENGQRYPTVWTNDIRVARGTPSCETSPPTLSAYEQFVQQVEDVSNQALEAAQEAKDAAASIKQYYIQSFTSQTGVTITAATHGCGETPWVDVYFLESGNYVKTFSYPANEYKVSINSAGDVNVTFYASSSGRIIIG